MSCQTLVAFDIDMRAILFGVFTGFFAVAGCGGKERQGSLGDGGAGAGIAEAAGNLGAAGDAATSGTAGASGGSAGVPTNNGACAPYCLTKAECCTDCTYPNHFDCQDRHCVSLGCTADSDCVPTNGPKSICRAVAGFPRCIEPCQLSSDCSNARAVCVAADDDGHKFCGALPALIVPCSENSDCIGVCDPATNQCGCSTDSQCPPGTVCAPLG